MLWSVLKILFFVVIVVALALGAGFVMENGPSVLLRVGSIEFAPSPLVAIICALLLLLAVWVILKLAGLLVAVVRFLNGDETAMSRYFDRHREKRGYEALSDGMMALASGEGQLALTKANRAERYLGKPELTRLLTAQAAEQVGDRKTAEEAYKAMLTDDRTRFVGVRGLMKQKLAAGETDTALKLAEKAFSMKPGHEEVQDTLLQLQAGNADWTGARKTLSAKLKHGSLPRDVHRRRDAVLALSEAKGVLDEGGSIEAREAAIEANRLSPDLVPAAVMAAHSYIEQDKPRYATRVIKKAWEAQPHPDLASAFAAIQPDESPEARLKRFQPLLRSHPEHEETRLLLAELNLAAEDFPAARKAVTQIASAEGANARALTIMAAVERGEGGDDHVVRAWLARALTAPRGPAWVCDKCQNIHGQWSPTCDNCGAFDTLSWREPPKAEVSMPGGVEMLPLLVGPAPEPEPEEAPVVLHEGEVEEAETVEPATEPEEDGPVEEKAK
ncbi:heme biosynthesis protein HemY [Vannielia litorea]|uniref:heme biosynthesis protein HemY n=1 Tax=Vannielia litorea TaxID=1217970 RepID=UPI001C950F17|nr:heme biosynthesis HemY N-terminal domain-containing protein [Vannielia litorea]MBY6154998.1 heme biosynthesis protein HemY [Vannielia litorea]